MAAALPANWRWLEDGTGRKPEFLWSAHAEGELLSIHHQWESRATLLACLDGALSQLDHSGALLKRHRHSRNFQSAAFGHVNGGGYAATDNRRLIKLDPTLGEAWRTKLSGDILAIATDPFAGHCAVSIDSAELLIFRSDGEQLARFETPDPLNLITMAPKSREIVGFSSKGWFGSLDIDGEELWSSRLTARVSDLQISGDGNRILCASPPGSILLFGRTGRSKGSVRTNGTVQNVAIGSSDDRITLTTHERELTHVDRSGTTLFSATSPVSITSLTCNPAGTTVYCGLESGSIAAVRFS